MSSAHSSGWIPLPDGMPKLFARSRPRRLSQPIHATYVSILGANAKSHSATFNYRTRRPRVAIFGLCIGPLQFHLPAPVVALVWKQFHNLLCTVGIGTVKITVFIYFVLVAGKVLFMPNSVYLLLKMQTPCLQSYRPADTDTINIEQCSPDTSVSLWLASPTLNFSGWQLCKTFDYPKPQSTSRLQISQHSNQMIYKVTPSTWLLYIPASPSELSSTALVTVNATNALYVVLNSSFVQELYDDLKIPTAFVIEGVALAGTGSTSGSTRSS